MSKLIYFSQQHNLLHCS